MAKAKKQTRMDAFRQIDKGEVSEVASPPRVENTAKDKRKLKVKKRGKNGSPIKKQHRRNMTDKKEKEEALLDELIKRNQERKAAEATMEESDSNSKVQFMQVKKKGKRGSTRRMRKASWRMTTRKTKSRWKRRRKKDNFRNQVWIQSLMIKVKRLSNKTQANKEVWMQSCQELFKKIQKRTPPEEFTSTTVYRFHQRKENESDAIALELESKIPKQNVALKSYFSGAKNRIIIRRIMAVPKKVNSKLQSSYKKRLQQSGRIFHKLLPVHVLYSTVQTCRWELQTLERLYRTAYYDREGSTLNVKTARLAFLFHTPSLENENIDGQTEM